MNLEGCSEPPHTTHNPKTYLTRRRNANRRELEIVGILIRGHADPLGTGSLQLRQGILEVTRLNDEPTQHCMVAEVHVTGPQRANGPNITLCYNSFVLKPFCFVFFVRFFVSVYVECRGGWSG